MKRQFYFLSYTDDTLVVCRYIQKIFLIFTFIFLIFTFMSKYFCKSLWQRETQVSFLEIIAYKQYNCLQVFLEVIILIFWLKSIFQRNKNIFISLVLKAKQQKGVHWDKLSLNVIWINSAINFFVFILPVYEADGHLHWY